MSNIIQELDRQRRDAKTAFLNGNYDEALKLAQVSLLDLANIPDGEKLGDAGGKLSWDREAIQAFIVQVEKARADAVASSNTTGGIAISRVEYTRGDV